MTELDLFSAPSGPKVCAKCVYICEGLSDRGTYYCDLSKKTVRPDDTCLMPGDPHVSRFQEVRV